MNKNRYYKTNSFPISCFLFSKDQQIAGVNETEKNGVKEFSFVKTPYLEELVDKYKFGLVDDPDLLVPVRKYEQARKYILDLINN